MLPDLRECAMSQPRYADLNGDAFDRAIGSTRYLGILEKSYRGA